MKKYLLGLLLAVATLPITRQDFSYPTVKGRPTVIGIVTDPALNRDSCGSSLVGSRALWVCRDTNPFNAVLPIICNTASWTDLPRSGGGTSLNMYGNNRWRSFYPLVPGNCDGENGRPGNQAGGCPDSFRYPHWPSSPPLVTSDDGQTTIAYTWICNSQLKPNSLDSTIPDPSTALYRVAYEHGYDTNLLPTTELVNPEFWAAGDFPYGVYGGIVRNNVAYLWGQDSNFTVALARVPVQSIENSASYEFFVGGVWTRNKPVVGATTASIPNVSAGGQGTYYWSEQWQMYTWIGQPSYTITAEFYITTAPAPEGPWQKPKHFYSGQNGNTPLPAYSIQAHPHLSDPDKNEIYLTYTKVDKEGYSTPLIHVEWENANPTGNSGCSAKYKNENGWCWRYCNGNSGDWCYTGSNCLCDEGTCRTKNKCGGFTCHYADPGCVKSCMGGVEKSPVGSTGCTEFYENGKGWCWRYCNGGNGDWCYTGKNCEGTCADRNECPGLPCAFGSKGCVQGCTNGNASSTVGK